MITIYQRKRGSDPRYWFWRILIDRLGLPILLGFQKIDFEKQNNIEYRNIL